jgi:hypothetical protein
VDRRELLSVRDDVLVVYELTPEGLKRRARSIVRIRSRKSPRKRLDFITIGLLTVWRSVFTAFDRSAAPQRISDAPSAAAHAGH